MHLPIEAEFRLHQIAHEAQDLSAEELRGVLVHVWNAFFVQREMLKETLAAEGIECNFEVRGLHPRELAEALRA